MEELFRFGSKYVTLLKPESNFPDKSNTPELFLSTLIEEGVVTSSQINKDWEPKLSKSIKICSVKHDGSTIYLKLVTGKETIKKNEWRKEKILYPHIVSVAVDFQNKLIEVRSSITEVEKYKEYIMKIMGFAAPYAAFSVPKMTKKTAEALCKILSAGVTSSHIALSSTVGSVKFIALKGVDLSKDETLKQIKEAFQGIGLSTNDTMDQEAVFKFTDPRTNIQFDVYMYVDIVKGYFKFKEEVNEAVIDHVKDALIKVTQQDNSDLTSDEIAARVALGEVLTAGAEAASGKQDAQLTLEFD